MGGHIEWHPVDEETVGQYIGQLDSNNKEIFEGDIDTSESDAPMFVVYHYDGFATKFMIGDNYTETCIQWDKTEITGNIYDNPQLLNL